MKTAAAAAYRAISRSLSSLLLCLAGLAFWSSPIPAHGQIFFQTSDNTSGFSEISEFSTTGTAISAPLFSTGTDNVWGAMAASGTNLYIINLGFTGPGSSFISEYTTAGDVVRLDLVTGLDSPAGIAVSDDGADLFVTDFADGTVSEYDAVTGQAINAPMASGLLNPEGIAVSGSFVFVVNADTNDSLHGSVSEYDTSGNTLALSLIPDLQSPQFITTSGSNLFITVTGTQIQGGSFTGAGSIAEYTFAGIKVSDPLVPNLTFPQNVVASGTNLFVYEQGQQIDKFSIIGVPWNPANPALISSFSVGSGVGEFAVLPEVVQTGTIVINSFSKTGPSVVGGEIRFDVAATAGLSVVVQSSLTPGDDTSWSDLSDGGAMVEDPNHPGSYSLTTLAYPRTSGVSFRAVGSETGFTDAVSAVLGSFDLSDPLVFLATAPAVPGQKFIFSATMTAGYSVRVQSSATPGVESSWTDLDDGGAGQMLASGSTFSLSDLHYPSGAAIYFRAIAYKSGASDVVSGDLGPFSTLINKTLQFEFPTYTVTNSGTQAIIGVIRGPNTPANVFARFKQTGGTAKSKGKTADYTVADPASLGFSFGSEFEDYIFLNITANTAPTPDKTIIFTLTQPPGAPSKPGAGANYSTTVTIKSQNPFQLPPATSFTVTPKVTAPLTAAEKKAGLKTGGLDFSPWTFTAVQSKDATIPTLALKVQYSTVPPPNEQWLDLNHGEMTAVGTKWSVVVEDIPSNGANRVWFRTVASADGCLAGNSPTNGGYKVVNGPGLTLAGLQVIDADAGNASNFSPSEIDIHDSDTIHYRFKYSNLGNSVANNVVLTAAVPQNTRFQSATDAVTPSTVHPQEKKNSSGDVTSVSWTFPTLPAGENGVNDYVDMVVTVFSAVDFNPTPNHATDSFGKTIFESNYGITSSELGKNSVQGVPELDALIQGPFSMTVTEDNKFVSAGDLITYTLSVTNNATFAVSSPVVTDQVPVGTALQTVYGDDGAGNFTNTALPQPNPNTNPSFQPVAGGRQLLTWKLADMAAKQTRTVKYTAQVFYDVPSTVFDSSHAIHTANIVNNQYQFTAAPPSGGSVPAFASDIPPVSAEILANPDVIAPVLGLSKLATGQGSLQAPVTGANEVGDIQTSIPLVVPPDGQNGDGVLHYEIHVRNSGNASASGIVVHDFINGNTNGLKPITSTLKDVNSIKLNGSPLTSSVLAQQHFVLNDGDAIPLGVGADVKTTRSIDFYLGTVPVTTTTGSDWIISYDVEASNSATSKADPVDTIIRTSDYFMTSTSYMNPVLGAPRETFAFVVRPVILSKDPASIILASVPAGVDFNKIPYNSVPPGGEFFYKLSIYNAGGIKASGVTVTCPLPKGVVYEGFFDTDQTTELTADEPATPAKGSQGVTVKCLIGSIDANNGVTNGNRTVLLKCKLLPDTDPKFPGAYRVLGAQTPPFQPTISGGYLAGAATHLRSGGFNTLASANSLVKVPDVQADSTTLSIAHTVQPQLFLGKFAPLSVNQDDTLTYIFFYGNTGDVTANNATVQVYVPDNTDLDTTNSSPAPDYNAKTRIATFTIGDVPLHSADCIVMEVKVRQDLGTILENSAVIHASNATGQSAGNLTTTVVTTSFLGHLHQDWNNFLGGFHINLGSAANNPAVMADFSAINENSLGIATGNAAVTHLKNGAFIIPLGPRRPVGVLTGTGVGQVLVGGPAEAVSGGTDLIEGASIRLVAGDGNAIDVQDIGMLTGTNLSNAISTMHSSRVGNVSVGGPGMIAPDGVTMLDNDSGAGAGSVLPAVGDALIGQDGGSLIGHGGSTIVAAGAGNIVAAGAGNIVSQGAGNIVSQGAGNIVSQGAGNIVAAGAGNIVSQGAGNIVSQGAGNIVSQGAGNIVSQGAGNIVSQGAGNIVSQGAGNFIPTPGAAQ